jgi:hypothetical protein
MQISWRGWHFVIGILGIFTLSLVGIVIYNVIGIGQVVGNMCSLQIRSRALASDRAREMTSFSVDCGAASSGKNYQIALVKPGEQRPDKNGKAFFLGDPGSYNVVVPEVKWESDESIRVNYSGLINLYKLELSVENIKINYGPRVNRNK